jgi:glycosyltransferase involved in cell wall biosynthesis
MKTISILIPCLNEIDNITLISDALIRLFENELKDYDYEIVFIDNYSTDGTRDALRDLCCKNKKIKAIFNIRNFGPSRSPVYGMIQTAGDCTIQMAADFQDPPDIVVQLVREWEKGYKIVIAKKSKSKENPLMFLCRSAFYKLFNRLGDIEHIEHFTGFGLYDKTFINIIRQLDDPIPYLRGLVTELGPAERAEIDFIQPRRKGGRTKTNFFSLYDVAMLGLTSYSKAFPRIATILGFLVAGISLIISLVYLTLKLVFWNTFPLGMAPMLISLFFLSSIQLFFIGFIGEYVMSIHSRIMKRPLVIEEERLNF